MSETHPEADTDDRTDGEPSPGRDADIEWVDPHDLREHPVNDDIYQDRDLDSDFVESVRTKGVLEPIVVTDRDGETIISGHRRTDAARQVGLDAVPVRTAEFDGEADEIQSIVDFNRQREKTRGEKIREGNRWLEAEKQKNKEKQRQAAHETNRQLGRDHDDTETGSPHGEKASDTGADSYEAAAETVGVGKNSLNRGVQVLETAEDDDEDEDVREVAQQEMDKLDRDEQSFRGASENLDATHELRELAECGDEIEREVARDALERVKADAIEAREAIDEAHATIERRRHDSLVEEAQAASAAADTYDVVVAAPHWNYQSVGWRVSQQNEHPFPPMDVDTLADLDIPASEDAVLWLWFSNPFVGEAVDLAERWGFEVQTILTWDRERYGPRLWLRNRTEHALLCTRGAPAVDLDEHDTIVRGPPAEHTQQPAAFYDLVEDACPGSKLELFATDARDGWTALGEDLVDADALAPDAREADAAEQDIAYGASETQVIQNKADIILAYPEGEFAYEDLDNEVLQDHIRELHHKQILVKTGERTIVDSDLNADGEHVENTRYVVNEFRVADQARATAREAAANREIEMPCGDGGLQNLGDGKYACKNPLCDDRFDAADLEGHR